jgi:hypothetical protein
MGGCMGRRICLARGRRESRRQSRAGVGRSDVRQLLRAVVLGQGVRAAIPAIAIPATAPPGAASGRATGAIVLLLVLLLLLQVRVPLVWVLVVVTVTPWSS